jgi:hypothetical protein
VGSFLAKAEGSAMASVIRTASQSASTPAAQTLAGVIDRWIFVFMAGLFVLTALVGFVPEVIDRQTAIQAGQRPPWPIVAHLHAAVMGAWLLLLLAQSLLMANGRRAFHKQLGMTAVVMAPAVVVAGFFMMTTMYQFNWALLQAAPPGVAEVKKKFLDSLVMEQVTTLLLFGGLVTWALLVRVTNPGMHKRLLILATVLPLVAAIDRIAWLPSSLPYSSLSPFLYTLLWIAPMFFWDLIRTGRVHRAYLVWGFLFVPTSLAIMQLWFSPWSIAVAERWMGVSG